MSISVVLLAYKEEENLKFLLPSIIENIKKTGEEYEILVIDTMQPLDNTKEVCEIFGAKYINQEESNFGGAFKTGIKYASKDKFLILDSDGSHDPKYIIDIYRKFVEGKFDVVIGSRYTKGGKTFDSKSSIMMSKLLNFMFRVCLGIKAKDISTDYRMYDTKLLKSVGEELQNKNYDILQEVLLKLKLKKENLKIGEVPIVFKKRVFGESKRKLILFIIDYIKSLVKLTCIRYPVIKNFVLYGCFGVIGAIIEFSVFSICIKTISNAEISNIIGAGCGFMFTFLMNTLLNFKVKTKILKRLIKYGCICLGGLIFSTVSIHILKDNVNIYLFKFILIIIVSVAQFILNKLITYKN